MRALSLWIATLFYWVISPCLANQLSWHFTAADINTLHSNPANYRLFYGNDPLQFGELRLPNNPGPYPVLIIIHGGCWISGFATLQNTSALADAFRDLGIATWNIEYRREDNIGGGWPGTFQDIAHATDFLRTIASKYSLDLNRIMVLGHSAGGHLALWVAARHKLSLSSNLYTQKPLKIRSVIALGGVPDLKAFRRQGEMICGSDVIGRLLGNSPSQIEEHYKEASPKELLPLGIPQILIYGSADQAVPMKFGSDYKQEAQKKGDYIKLFVIEDAGHHEYNAPNSIAWPTIKSAVLSSLLKK